MSIGTYYSENPVGNVLSAGNQTYGALGTQRSASNVPTPPSLGLERQGRKPLPLKLKLNEVVGSPPASQFFLACLPPQKPPLSSPSRSFLSSRRTAELAPSIPPLYLYKFGTHLLRDKNKDGKGEGGDIWSRFLRD